MTNSNTIKNKVSTVSTKYRYLPLSKKSVVIPIVQNAIVLPKMKHLRALISYSNVLIMSFKS